MADIFYYIGFGYIICLIYGIVTTIFDNGKESKKAFGEMKDSVPKDLTEINMEGSLPEIISTTVSPMVSTLKKHGKKNMLAVILSILFFAWLIMGAFSKEDNSTYFVFILVQILSYQLFIIIVLLMNAFRRKDQFIVTSVLDEAEGASKSKVTTVVHIMNEAIKLLVVSFILYNHFILQNI